MVILAALALVLILMGCVLAWRYPSEHLAVKCSAAACFLASALCFLLGPDFHLPARFARALQGGQEGWAMLLQLIAAGLVICGGAIGLYRRPQSFFEGTRQPNNWLIVAGLACGEISLLLCPNSNAAAGYKEKELLAEYSMTSMCEGLLRGVYHAIELYPHAAVFERLSNGMNKEFIREELARRRPFKDGEDLEKAMQEVKELAIQRTKEVQREARFTDPSTLVNKGYLEPQHMLCKKSGRPFSFVESDAQAPEQTVILRDDTEHLKKVDELGFLRVRLVLYRDGHVEAKEIENSENRVR